MPRKVADTVNFARYRLANGLLKLSAKGKPTAELFNVAAILEHDDRWHGVLGWDEFAQCVWKRKPPPFADATVGQWSDVDEIRTAIWIAEQYDFAATVDHVRKAMYSAAHRASFHPVRDYLDSLVWDGEPRVLEWACRYLGAADSGDVGAYNMLAASKWLISAVARVRHPGCKADNVLILEGPQGRLKSTALAVLGGDWFMDTPFALHDRDRFVHIQGKWIIELAELDGFSRAESSAAKAFFSSPRDRYTPKYIAHAIDVPRRCVFAGTVNQGTYLHDKTGNRRYWPIRVGRVDIDALRRDRDQLWAEASQLFEQGVRYWVEQSEVSLFALQQETRETPDAIEEVIRSYIADREEVTMRTLLEVCLDLQMKDWTPAIQTRVGQIMSALGWEVTRVRIKSGANACIAAALKLIRSEGLCHEFGRVVPPDQLSHLPGEGGPFGSRCRDCFLCRVSHLDHLPPLACAGVRAHARARARKGVVQVVQVGQKGRHSMIPAIDADLRRWAEWRVNLTNPGYHYRSPIADLRLNPTGTISSVSHGNSRAWGCVWNEDWHLARLEHGVRWYVTAHQRRLVSWRYCGVEELDPPQVRPLLPISEQCARLGCTAAAYKEALHAAHVRLERHVLARRPLTCRPDPPHNRRAPDKVE